MNKIMIIDGSVILLLDFHSREKKIVCLYIVFLLFYFVVPRLKKEIKNWQQSTHNYLRNIGLGSF